MIHGCDIDPEFGLDLCECLEDVDLVRKRDLGDASKQVRPDDFERSQVAVESCCESSDHEVEISVADDEPTSPEHGARRQPRLLALRHIRPVRRIGLDLPLERTEQKLRLLALDGPSVDRHGRLLRPE
ncbi:hypothetical protein [Kineosporia sp. A_224]|uniref:hypothetical protein n=1 Tax=Kineosporia sp. A_224 TaxID=1962180 RepID=UPI001304537E|nr:hypothetical protein [Kineosporia sp. A_224]